MEIRKHKREVREEFRECKESTERKDLGSGTAVGRQDGAVRIYMGEGDHLSKGLGRTKVLGQKGRISYTHTHISIDTHTCFCWATGRKPSQHAPIQSWN